MPLPERLACATTNPLSGYERYVICHTPAYFRRYLSSSSMAISPCAAARTCGEALQLLVDVDPVDIAVRPGDEAVERDHHPLDHAAHLRPPPPGRDEPTRSDHLRPGAAGGVSLEGESRGGRYSAGGRTPRAAALLACRWCREHRGGCSISTGGHDVSVTLVMA